MTRDEIIRMAREAGMDPHDMSSDWTVSQQDIERFAALVATAEREACAEVCDKSVYELLLQQDRKDLIELAVGFRDVIRARGAA